MPSWWRRKPVAHRERAASERAPAKINLSLHVVGRRPDGLHLLDSLVAFAGIGDNLTFSPAPEIRLHVSGAFAAQVPPDENIVVRAAEWLCGTRGAEIALEKKLPVASGMGGGSADAAAAIRGLSRMWKVPLPAPEEALRLGADVPVCIRCEPARMRGVGERIESLRCLPEMPAVLVNPGRSLSTAEVFGKMADIDPEGGISAIPGRSLDLAEAVAWLGGQRNDLEPAARGIAPEVAEVRQALAATGAGIARMTGSGATCFGVFASSSAARSAADRVRRFRPDWWVASTVIGRRAGAAASANLGDSRDGLV